MATCFIEHTPGFELGESADAKSAISLVTELEDVYIQGRNTLPEEPPVVFRLSVIMVRIWTNWMSLFNTFLKDSTDVHLQPLTSVRVLTLRESALRGALLSALRSLAAEDLAELQRLCAELVTRDYQLQPAVSELRQLTVYLADITDRMLTSGPASKQSVSAGPSAVIRHMGYALLHGVGCFSTALAGGESTSVWGTPSPPTVPAPPPSPPPTAAPAQCQLMEQANSEQTILADLEPLMKESFDIGLTFFSLLKSEPVFAASASVTGPLTGPGPESRSAGGEGQTGGDRMTWLLDSVRLSARRYQFPLEVIEEYLGKLEQMWTLLAAGAGSSPLGEAKSDHNLTEAVTALTACFVEHVPGYQLELILEAKTTDLEPPEAPLLKLEERTASDSDSVTLRVADILANLWRRVLRPAFAIFVRPSSIIRLHPERNLRVLSLSRPRLHASLLAAMSGLDVVQRATLQRVCTELTTAQLSFAVSELQQLMEPLAELCRLRLTRARQAEEAAGPAAIVVSMNRALPHSLGCFLAALSGAETGETSAVLPLTTETPAVVLPDVAPLLPGIPPQDQQPAVDPPTEETGGATSPPPTPTRETTAAAGDDSADQDSAAEQEESFLTEQDVHLVDDILMGLG